MSEPTTLFTESPASWNTRYITEDGFTCQLTLRSENGMELLEKAQRALIHLREEGCIPFYGYSSGNQTNVSNQTEKEVGLTKEYESDPSWCPTHEVFMTRREKEGKVWYSHKADGKWCNNGMGKKDN